MLAKPEADISWTAATRSCNNKRLATQNMTPHNKAGWPVLKQHWISREMSAAVNILRWITLILLRSCLLNILRPPNLNEN
jgi:hypothetical protein